MTVLGKMMAIFVLILSILQGALTVMLFVSRSQWVAQNKELVAKSEAANASANQFYQDAERVRGEAKASEASFRAQLADKDKDLRLEQQLRVGAEKALDDEKQKALAAESSSRAAQADAKLRQADNERMLAVIKERDAQIAGLINENKKEREDRVNAEIQRNSALLAAQKMEDKLREAMKEIVRLSRGTTTVAKTSQANPPAENMEGLVSEADANGLVEITLGSDAGLKAGHTLEAYRIAAIPEQSQYLGMIRIRTVTANKAVAEPVGKMAAPLQRGDHVSSRILGGG
jgi:hypothetical protein